MANYPLNENCFKRPGFPTRGFLVNKVAELLHNASQDEASSKYEATSHEGAMSQKEVASQDEVDSQGKDASQQDEAFHSTRLNSNICNVKASLN